MKNSESCPDKEDERESGSGSGFQIRNSAEQKKSPVNLKASRLTGQLY